MSYCLNKYVRKHGEGFSWNDVEKKPFPLPSDTCGQMECSSPFKIRHALNAVTASYSLQWFDWTRWERLIDWMALNGINAPLMPIGHEYVQAKMLEQFNLTDSKVWRL